MNHVKRGMMVVFLAAAAALVGCDDWDFGGSSDQTSDRHSMVNFTGMYRAQYGGVLVSDYTETPNNQDGPSAPAAVTNVVVGNTDGMATVFQGTLTNRSIVPGTVTIRLPGYVLTDNGDGLLSGTAGSTGEIQYANGGWAVDTGGAAPAPGQIRASYQYTVSPPEQGSGASGRRPVMSLNVRQDGNDLRFTDNNGSVYEGKLGNVQFTGTQQDWAQVFAQFTVRGTNNVSGLHITITGTLQAQRAEGVAQRYMSATWLERGGRTGDIRGRAQDVGVAAPAAN